MKAIEEFRIGEVYFSVTYADSDLLLPIVRTLVFLGKNIEGDEMDDRWYFQDTESYSTAGHYPDIKGNADSVEVHRVGQDGLSLLFDLDGLHRDLAACFDRRARRG